MAAGTVLDTAQKQEQVLLRKRKRISPDLFRNYDLYILIFPVLLYYLIFHYLPIYGVIIAFKDFSPVKGIMGSPWVGFEHFIRFFNSYTFMRVIKNTFGVSLYTLVVGFPAPIILALAMNEVKNKSFKKLVQTVTYMPHFISVVVLVGMVITFLSPQNGIVNIVLKQLGVEPIFFMGEPKMFKSIFVFTNIWQNAGWGSIVYMAALASIDEELYEAAIVDGASKLKRLWHITLPCLLPTIIVIFILNIGKIMNVGFEKILLMQNQLNMETSDVIQTYVYRAGLLGSQYSFSAAVGLFNSVINSIILVTFNKLSRKYTESSLW